MWKRIYHCLSKRDPCGGITIEVEKDAKCQDVIIIDRCAEFAIKRADGAGSPIDRDVDIRREISSCYQN